MPDFSDAASGASAGVAEMADRLRDLLAETEPGRAAPRPERPRIVDFAKAAYEVCFDRRELLERVWWRNLLYLAGRQWIFWDAQRRQFADRRLQKWVPRPVTNIVAENVETILSVFQAVKPSVECRPVLGESESGETRRNILAAALANRYEPVLRDEHGMTEVERETDWWVVLTGNAFWHVWWDSDASRGIRTVARAACPACGQAAPPGATHCPNCRAPLAEVGSADRLRAGRGRTDVCSPFEVAAPAIVSSIGEVPYLFRLRWRPPSYYRDRLPREQYAKLRFSMSPEERSLRYLLQASTLSDFPSEFQHVLATGGGPTKSEGLEEFELWVRPCQEFPEGLVARFAGRPADGTLLELPDEGLPGPLPHVTPQGERLMPWVHVRYGRFGKRFWAPSPIDRIIPKQDTINRADSLALLILARMANPIWILPDTTSVKQFSGTPGVVLRYKVLGPNAAEPKRLPGENIPGSVVRWRQEMKQDVEQLLGTYDVLKGARPLNVEAFSAMQLLVERSQSRFGIPLEERGRAYADWFRLALELERLYGPETRRRAMLGPNGSYTAEVLRRADLVGQFQIVVEDGSQMPKTSLGVRAAIQQLQAMGVIDVRDQETRYRILAQFGRTDLTPGLDVDVKAALAEQDAFEQWARTATFSEQPGPEGQPILVPTVPPPGTRQVWHNDAVHASEHRRWANGETMQVLLAERPEVAPFVAWMIMQHLQALQPPAGSAPPEAPGRGRDGQGIGAGRAMERATEEAGQPRDAAAEAPPQFAGEVVS